MIQNTRFQVSPRLPKEIAVNFSRRQWILYLSRWRGKKKLTQHQRLSIAL